MVCFWRERSSKYSGFRRDLLSPESKGSHSHAQKVIVFIKIYLQVWKDEKNSAHIDLWRSIIFAESLWFIDCFKGSFVAIYLTVAHDYFIWNIFKGFSFYSCKVFKQEVEVQCESKKKEEKLRFYLTILQTSNRH